MSSSLALHLDDGSHSVIQNVDAKKLVAQLNPKAFEALAFMLTSNSIYYNLGVN